VDALDGWTRSEHTDDVAGVRTTHPVWRRGSGPGVVVVHELPGLTAGVIRFGEELVAAGFTVLLPHLFGPVGREFGGPGVGALGMCFTGGFALAMMVDDSVAAPVLCQPSVPFAVGPTRSRDLNLSPGDLDVVRGRCAAGQQVLGVRYRKDPAVGRRFERLATELGDAFIRVELEGSGHSTVTEHRSQEAVDAILEFFGGRLR